MPLHTEEDFKIFEEVLRSIIEFLLILTCLADVKLVGRVHMTA